MRKKHGKEPEPDASSTEVSAELPPQERLQHTPILSPPRTTPRQNYITVDDFLEYKDTISGAVNAFTAAAFEKFSELEAEISFLKDQNAACIAQIGDLGTAAPKANATRSTVAQPTEEWHVATGRGRHISWASDVIEVANRFSTLSTDGHTNDTGSINDGSNYTGSTNNSSTNASGHDAEGPIARGTDARGKDARGTDARGTDAHGTDAHGIDARGTDARSTDARGRSTRGTDARGLSLIHI